MEYICKILMTERVTHDVKRFILEKPQGFKFVPGHAMMISLKKEGWEKEKRSFTMTSLNDDLVLEFTIKNYPQYHAVTEQIHKLNPGDSLILSDMFGTIRYTKPGVFIAGGAGATPFIAILRQLAKDNLIKGNTLIFSNKKHEDIILEREFKLILGENCIFTLTREKRDGYEHGRIDEEFLKRYVKDFKQEFYICGPDKFVSDIKKILERLKAPSEVIVFER